MYLHLDESAQQDMSDGEKKIQMYKGILNIKIIGLYF